MIYEYKTVSTRTLAGLEEAERLQTAGWKIINNGFYSVQFMREKEI
jgi:hypothetical protein